MSQTGKLMPILDHQSTKLLNLTVLQRIDPFVEEILITAAHVTFYEFNIEGNQWSRKDVEGSLFVVKRNAQPRFQFIVMNRRNADNLVENLLGDFEYEVQLPYLLYRNAAQEVNGIWFYDPHECEEVADLFSRIITAYSKAPPNPKVPSSKSDFEELEAVPSMSGIEVHPEPSSTASTAIEGPQDLSFFSAFNAALNIGSNASNVAISRQPYLPSSPVPFSTYATSGMQAPSPTPQASLRPIPAASATTLHEVPDPISSTNQITNLVKPSSFLTPLVSSSTMVPPIYSSMQIAAAVHPPLNLQRPYGTPLLQPFPPPTPPLSLTPNSNFSSFDGPHIGRDKVRDALLMLLQDDQFIDMFYQALLKVHKS